MQVVNSDLVDGLVAGNCEPVKFVLNERGIHFFPQSQQHQDSGLPGLTYVEGHFGNALAGLVRVDVVEIRYHASFTDDRVRALWQLVCLHVPAFQGLRVSYQSRSL